MNEVLKKIGGAFNEVLTKEGKMNEVLKKIGGAFFIRLSLAFLLLTPAVQAKKYIVHMKDQKAFARAYQQMQKKVLPMSHSGEIKFLGASVKGVKGLTNLGIFIVESDRETLTIEGYPGIQSVEEDVIFQGAPSFYTNQLNRIIPSGGDREVPPSSELTWGQQAINVEGAWEHTRGEGARVLIMDTGLDDNHPEFQENFVKGKNFSSEIPEEGIPEYFDNNGHGTHTAGIVLGRSVGVAPRAELFVAKVCGGAGYCSVSGMLESVDWGITEGVDVISISISGPLENKKARKTYERAEEAGIAVVAASGNGGGNAVGYPAGFSTVLAVGAVDSTLKRAHFSQYGPKLDLVGPGVGVRSSFSGESIVAEVQFDVGKGSQNLNHSVGVGSGFAESPIVETDLVFVGLGRKENFTEEANVNGKIALISRGEITFKEKADNAIANGAVAVIIYNNEEGMLTPYLSFEELSVPVICIEQTVGNGFQERLGRGEAVEISIATTKAPAYQELRRCQEIT